MNDDYNRSRVRKVGFWVGGVALSLIIGCASGTYAATEQIKIKINGTPFVPRDPDSGEKMEIIVQGGRTYLPVRAIAEALDVNIVWDEKTKTVLITSK